MFTCPRCGRVSHNPKDAEYGYCGACERFTEGEAVFWHRCFGDTPVDWDWVDAMADQFWIGLPEALEERGIL